LWEAITSKKAVAGEGRTVTGSNNVEKSGCW
jgi:hypothetical protein